MHLPLKNKIILILLIILLAVLGQQKLRQYKLQKSIEKEKQKLQEQLDALQGKNEDLKQTLSFLDSPTYKELVAKQQLNMQKDGEEVYNFIQNPNQNFNQQDQHYEPKKSNFQKWVSYFLNSSE